MNAASEFCRRRAVAQVRFGARRALVIASAWLLLIVQSASAQSPTRSTSSLQSLVNDTALQFHLAYRHSLTEHGRRRQQLVEVIAAWREAERNDVNNRLLAEWLRGAIRSSMPGSREPLPPAPKFQRRAAEQLNLRRDNDSRPDRAPAPAMDKSTGDPFSDDPL